MGEEDGLRKGRRAEIAGVRERGAGKLSPPLPKDCRLTSMHGRKPKTCALMKWASAVPGFPSSSAAEPRWRCAWAGSSIVNDPPGREEPFAAWACWPCRGGGNGVRRRDGELMMEGGGCAWAAPLPPILPPTPCSPRAHQRGRVRGAGHHHAPVRVGPVDVQADRRGPSPGRRRPQLRPAVLSPGPQPPERRAREAPVSRDSAVSRASRISARSSGEVDGLDFAVPRAGGREAVEGLPLRGQPLDAFAARSVSIQVPEGGHRRTRR
jgi:hypothetical protein